MSVQPYILSSDREYVSNVEELKGLDTGEPTERHQMTLQSQTLAPLDSNPFVPNIATDRCDASDCKARAAARVTLKSGGQLLFCGHHTNDFRANLLDKGAVIDEATQPTL